MAKKNRKDRVLVEPDGVIFAVENRPFTPEEKRLLREHLQKSRREFHEKLKAGKVKIPPYLKKYFRA